MVVVKSWIESGERNVQINLKFPSLIDAHSSNNHNTVQIIATVLDVSCSKKVVIQERTYTAGMEQTPTIIGQG